jgi:hypothetical protein
VYGMLAETGTVLFFGIEAGSWVMAGTALIMVGAALCSLVTPAKKGVRP